MAGLFLNKSAANGVIRFGKGFMVVKIGQKAKRIGVVRQGFLCQEFNICCRIKGNRKAGFQGFFLPDAFNNQGNGRSIYCNRIKSGQSQLNGYIGAMALSCFCQVSI